MFARSSKIFFTAGLVGSLTISAIGCSAMKASPAKDSGFLESPEKMAQQERYPFNRVWISEDWPAKRDSYKKVIIEPVNTTHLEAADWWSKQNAKTQEDMKKDIAYLSTYLHERLVEAIQKDPNHRIKVVNTPGPDTIVLETAIVEITPSKAFFNAASTAAGFVVPGAGLLSTFGTGSVAIEAQIRDSQTQTVYAQLADRESNKSAVVNVAALTWYSGAKEAMSDWSEQLVKLANTPLEEKVADSSPIKLMTW